MTRRTLPPLPVDDVALDLYLAALDPSEGRSSLGDVLRLYAEMGGSDPEAVEEELFLPGNAISEWCEVMRDPSYHPHDLIRALIDEVRRLRAATDG